MKLANIESTLIIALASGNKILESNLGQGAMAFLKDIGAAVAIASVSITVIAVIVLLIKKSATETNESGASKNFNKSILIVLSCGITSLVVGGVLAIIGSYFGVAV